MPVSLADTQPHTATHSIPTPTPNPAEPPKNHRPHVHFKHSTFLIPQSPNRPNATTVTDKHSTLNTYIWNFSIPDHQHCQKVLQLGNAGGCIEKATERGGGERAPSIGPHAPRKTKARARGDTVLYKHLYIQRCRNGGRELELLAPAFTHAHLQKHIVTRGKGTDADLDTGEKHKRRHKPQTPGL